jgi:hypothetical protein
VPEKECDRRRVRGRGDRRQRESERAERAVAPTGVGEESAETVPGSSHKQKQAIPSQSNVTHVFIFHSNDSGKAQASILDRKPSQILRLHPSLARPAAFRVHSTERAKQCLPTMLFHLSRVPLQLQTAHGQRKGPEKGGPNEPDHLARFLRPNQAVACNSTSRGALQ